MKNKAQCGNLDVSNARSKSLYQNSALLRSSALIRWYISFLAEPRCKWQNYLEFTKNLYAYQLSWCLYSAKIWHDTGGLSLVSRLCPRRRCVTVLNVAKFEYGKSKLFEHSASWTTKYRLYLVNTSAKMRKRFSKSFRADIVYFCGGFRRSRTWFVVLL